MGRMSQFIEIARYAAKAANESINGLWTFAETVTITKPTGTKPLTVTSTTKCDNLNADRVDGADVGTSGAAIPLLNGNNTWSGTNDYTAAVTGLSANFHYPSTFAYFRDDFTGNSNNGGEYLWGNGAAGGGSVANDSGSLYHPGVRRLATGAAATSHAVQYTRTAFNYPGGGDNFEAIFKISSITGITVRIGLVDITADADAVDGYYFEFDPATSANWLTCTSNSSSRTKTPSSSAVVANTWYRTKLCVNAANTSVDFYVNDVLIGTNTATIPSGSGDSFGCSALIRNTGASLAVNLDLDLVYWYNRSLVR